MTAKPLTQSPTPGIGHNQPLVATGVAGIAGDRLKSFIDRIERLEEERKAIGDDIREVYSEAKGTGFDVKVIRLLIRLRKMDTADRREQEEILTLYLRAMDMEV